MNASNWINLGILVVTALVGILAWVRARKAAREAHDDQESATKSATRSAAAAEAANEIQMRLVEIEEQRQEGASLEVREAKLSARIDREPRYRAGRVATTDYYLVVSNAGRAGASNLEIKLGGKAIDEQPGVRMRQASFEMSIGPSGDIRFPLAVSRGWAPPFECQLAWDDDSGVRGAWQGTLT